jgi:ATP-dependent DNA ligase
VVEVRYDKVQGRRFRHGTKLLRLRPDKSPEQCTWRGVRPPLEPGDRTLARLLGSVPGGD